MKIKEGGGEYQRNTRTTARRITRSHDIVSFVSYMRHSISLDIPESTFIKESSKVRRPFRLHLASPLINASGWPLETRQLAIGLLHPQLRIERFDRIHDTLSIPFPFRNETKRNETHLYTRYVQLRFVSGFRFIRIDTTPSPRMRNTAREMSAEGVGDRRGSMAEARGSTVRRHWSAGRGCES